MCLLFSLSIWLVMSRFSQAFVYSRFKVHKATYSMTLKHHYSLYNSRNKNSTSPSSCIHTWAKSKNTSTQQQIINVCFDLCVVDLEWKFLNNLLQLTPNSFNVTHTFTVTLSSVLGHQQTFFIAQFPDNPRSSVRQGWPSLVHFLTPMHLDGTAPKGAHTHLELVAQAGHSWDPTGLPCLWGDCWQHRCTINLSPLCYNMSSALQAGSFLAVFCIAGWWSPEGNFTTVK